ncbi:serine/threonine protein kinase [Streptomyces sp. NBC_00340]|uniref:serine/threonine-protein kinase n=1 Tax=Streptomyces sp. NBC_00340 TaxID=2975716 RepID=UPI00225C3739|nr:serine/threonine-protein kinase [Streptomyces sp. NBC_00340]MCX5130863.1 serine/threonine protein kinase [Streptomyces sp. NBC_00340]
MGRPGWVLGGRYRVGNQLGHGGYGRVWEAYDEVLSRRVAVKAVGPTDPGAVLAERFAREVARLDHPNLVTVYELVEADGVVWSVMPFVSGPSLTEYLAENGRMSGERVREVATALLDALAALHEAGVVHGDVRPANVLMAEGGWMLLPGVGAMARDDDSDTIEHDGWTVATADYIAPERLHGAPQAPSNDLFSLGAILHELVTGRPPFQRGDVWGTLAAVAREEPPPLGHIGELGRLIDGLLDKDPERRLTAAQARRVLDWAQEEAYAVSTPSMATPWSARRNTVGLASLLLLPLLMLAAVLVWTAPRAHVAAGNVSDLFVSLLPWALFTLGLCVLAVQVRAALTRHRARVKEPVPVWRCYARSLAPPARWTDEERARRRAAAEQAVNEALLTVDRRVASASPGPGEGRGTTDV